MSAVRFAIDWWKERHRKGYFPTMEQHLNWKLYDVMVPWFLVVGEPTASDVALEIGSGYGQWMAPLSRIVKEVHGFDIHGSLVDKSVDLLRNFVNANMVLGDGTTIPNTLPQEYSLVYSISVFQHMPRAIVQGYLNETKRVLAPTGRAVFHFRHDDGTGPYSKDIVVNHKGDWSVGWSEQEATEACAAAGLAVITVITGGNSLIVKAVHA